MKTYLVTGGSGFIGSNFIRFIFKKYNNSVFIINLDKLTYAGNLINLSTIESNRNYKFIKGDISNKDLIRKVFQDYDINYVINFAAESHVDRSIEDPEVFIKTNVYGTSVLLNEAKNSWSDNIRFKKERKFVQISTDEVYGSLDDKGLFTETSPLDPHSPYSASKASADLIAKSYFDTYKMPINITRCSNNYGPYQLPEKFIPLVINNCLNKKAIPIYGDGLNIRDWLHVEDHCRGIDTVINDGLNGEIYNIGGNNEKTNIQLAKTIIAYFQSNVDSSIDEELINFVKDRLGHDRRYAIDSTKISSTLNWYPQIEFNKGLNDTIKWYLNNKKWVEDVTTGEYISYYNRMYRNR